TVRSTHESYRSEKTMANAEGPEGRILKAVQDSLRGFHGQIEEIDRRLASLAHRREELVAAARLALIDKLPKEVKTNLPHILTARTPAGLPASEHVAELAAIAASEGGALRETLEGYHQQIQTLDRELEESVHKREELVAAARLSLVQGVPEEIRGQVAELAPMVAMALACR